MTNYALTAQATALARQLRTTRKYTGSYKPTADMFRRSGREGGGRD